MKLTDKIIHDIAHLVGGEALLYWDEGQRLRKEWHDELSIMGSNNQQAFERFHDPEHLKNITQQIENYHVPRILALRKQIADVLRYFRKLANGRGLK